MQIVETIKRINSVLMTMIRVILIVFGTALTILVIANVILRYVFNYGISWSEEAARFLFIWCSFLGAMMATNESAHMRLDFVVERFPGVSRKAVEAVALLILLVLVGVLFYGGIEVVATTWQIPTSALKIPKGLVYLCAPICFGYIFLRSIGSIVEVVNGREEEKQC